RLATAHAEGGLKMSEPLPDISHLLLDASSQAGTSGGKYSISFLPKSRTLRTVSVLTVILPLASTRSAPKERNRAPTHFCVSVVPPIGSPNAYPALCSFCAAVEKVSQVQSATPAAGSAPAGYMACTSMPACSFSRSNRVQHGRVRLPRVDGTTTQCPLTFPL